MVNSSAVLWLQFAYSVWQFVRVAKYCRIPYALFVHTLMWLTGRWSRPFALRVYLVLETGREKFYVDRGGAESVLKDCLDRTDRFKVESRRPGTDSDSDLAMISIPAVHYKLCIQESRINKSFLWNYLRDKLDCITREAEPLLPGLAILDRVSDLEGLKMMCQGGFIPVKRKERLLAVPGSEHDLNKNFMRFLSTIPLMAQALRYENSSVWISVAILVVDLLSRFVSLVWQLFNSWFFYLFTVCVTNTYFRPQTREMLSTLCSIVSRRMQYSDQVRKSLVRVRKGDVVYTMSTFNLVDFEKIIDHPFERQRKTPVPFSEEKFGKFTFCGEELEVEEGSPVLTHYVDSSRIDTIFKDDGSFYNFRNNEHLHFGIWKKGKDNSKDSKETKDSEGSKETEGSEGSKETEDSEGSKETKDSEGSKETEGSEDFKDLKDSKDSEETEDSEGSEDTEDNFNNFQDLLQIMEEMQMLPFIQTDKDRFQSMHFNMFLSPDRSLKDLTFLVAKKTTLVGG